MTTATKFSRPGTDEYAEYYEQYIGKVTGDFMDAFQQQPDQLDQLLGNLSHEEVSKLHDPYTWSLKQVMGHLIDCERIFSTRALRIGVGDEAPLPGIDQDVYVANLDYEKVTMDELLAEFRSLREGNVMLAKRIDQKNLERSGTASDLSITCKANFYILAGHVIYHEEIMRRRIG